MVKDNDRKCKINSHKHHLIKTIMCLHPQERTEEQEKMLEDLMSESKFFQGEQMVYEDFKDLVQ